MKLATYRQSEPSATTLRSKVRLSRRLIVTIPTGQGKINIRQERDPGRGIQSQATDAAVALLHPATDMPTVSRSVRRRLREHPISLFSARVPFEERIGAYREPLVHKMLLICRHVFHIYPTGERRKAKHPPRSVLTGLARWASLPYQRPQPTLMINSKNSFRKTPTSGVYLHGRTKIRMNFRRMHSQADRPRNAG